MSSRRHDSLALHFRHTAILQPPQERLVKKFFFQILLRNDAFLTWK